MEDKDVMDNGVVLKDGGRGVTAWSLDFWNSNKAGIGKISRILISLGPLAADIKKTPGPEGREYYVDYYFVAYGASGVIMLSGCTCGYNGEGPHGTAKILVELGMTQENASRLILSKHIDYRPDEKGWE
jgi:hypothetical protein